MKVLVSEVARADVRRIDQVEAIRILRSISVFARTGQGDVKVLSGAHAGKFRLRVGDYRVIFRIETQRVMFVLRVVHRSRAY